MKATTLYLLAITVISMLFCCKSETDHTINSINSLKSQPVIMPKNSMIIKNKEIVEIDNYSHIKLVVYSDSNSCNNCTLNNFEKWCLDSKKKCKRELMCYFIFNPLQSELKKFENLVKYINFDYPIILDTIGEFERLNPHLPKNKAMHTFLLDENNNVILVGNPLQSKQIEKMFYEEVEKRLK